MNARVESFERRLLYAADHPAAWLGAALDAPPIAETARLVAPLRLEERTAQDASAAAVPANATQGGVELVVVDTSLADHAQLLADLARQRQAGRAIEVLTVGAGEDGIARIGAWLAGRQGVSAIHLLAHGAAGQVQLGGSQLDATSLGARAAELAAWGAALSPEADLLVYGCDVAATAAGRQLLADLALAWVDPRIRYE